MYSKISYGSEGSAINLYAFALLMYNKISYGSEVFSISTIQHIAVQYSTVSYGSEGLSSINSDGSEELYFIYNIIDSLFFCFFVRDSLKQMCRDLFL